MISAQTTAAIRAKACGIVPCVHPSEVRISEELDDATQKWAFFVGCTAEVRISGF
jgi:hypothetical protein